METITSPNNPRIKTALRLYSSRGRKQQNRIIIFGQREIERAILSGLELTEVFICSEVNTTELAWWTEHSEKLDRISFDLPETLFQKLTYGDRQDDLVAIAQRPSTTLNDLSIKRDESSSKLALGVVQAIEKPGNLGAVIRSADGAGIDAVMVADPLCDPFHPNCIRASLGTVFSMPIVCDTSANIMVWLVEKGVHVFATRVDATLAFYDADFETHSALVIGNETGGLTDQWQGDEVTPIYLPMNGIADSLNLSASAAIVFYELARQRATKP